MVWDEPAPTLTTQFYGFGNGRFGHPEQDRGLSLREGAILQGFPETYSFVPEGEQVQFKHLGRLIGNAVPVDLARVIGQSLLDHIAPKGELMPDSTMRVTASSPVASRRMRSVRQKGTSSEMLLRRALFARGLRYRVQYPVLTKPRRVADLVFVGRKVAVFVDGCFWHGCPEHGTWPKKNAKFWRSKIEANIARDRDTDERLVSNGWTLVRVWSHEDPDEAAARIERLVRPHRSETDRR